MIVRFLRGVRTGALIVILADTRPRRLVPGGLPHARLTCTRARSGPIQMHPGSLSRSVPHRARLAEWEGAAGCTWEGYCGRVVSLRFCGSSGFVKMSLTRSHVRRLPVRTWERVTILTGTGNGGMA